MKRKMRAITVRLAALAAAAVVVFLAASWIFIGWTDEGTDYFPGGVILRDSAGRIIRVSLGEGDRKSVV